MNEAANLAVMEIAKEFIRCLQRVAPKFERAFYRFRLEPLVYGGNASYVSGVDILLLDPFENSAFFESVNERGRRLLHELSKSQGVMLLTVTSGFDYKIDFECENLDRWKITKVDGSSGLPAGL